MLCLTFYTLTFSVYVGVTQGRSSPTLVAYTAAGAENGDGGSREAVDLEKEKEAEAEREIELQVQMVRRQLCDYECKGHIGLGNTAI